jgi:hypothetical protein
VRLVARPWATPRPPSIRPTDEEMRAITRDPLLDAPSMQLRLSMLFAEGERRYLAANPEYAFTRHRGGLQVVWAVRLQCLPTGTTPA